MWPLHPGDDKLALGLQLSRRFPTDGDNYGARPKILSEILCLAPNLLVLRGMKFTTMGKPLKANPMAQD